MTIRKLEEKDYELLCSWWADWGWTAPPQDMLPDNGAGGLMVEVDGKPVFAGFIYVSNSKTCWIEWIISNKKHKENRKELLLLLVSSLTNIAQMSGGKYCLTMLKSKSLIQVYSECGYMKGDGNSQEMIKVLN